MSSALGLIRRDGAQDPPLAKLSARVRKHLARQPAGLYRVSAGRSPAITKFGAGVSVQSAMTSTRIASSRSGEGHWLVKVYPKGSPKVVVVRHITGSGATKYRVEEWGDALRQVRSELQLRRNTSKRALDNIRIWGREQGWDRGMELADEGFAGNASDVRMEGLKADPFAGLGRGLGGNQVLAAAKANAQTRRAYMSGWNKGIVDGYHFRLQRTARRSG